jgi:diguanylate cyclase
MSTFVYHTLVAISYSESAQVGLPVTVALGAIALIGYLFGERTRATQAAVVDQRRQQELDRAARIAWQLETIAEGLRRDLIAHHSQVSGFKRSLRQAKNEGNDKAWERLCNEAEAMLGPTMQLAHQLSHAYDQIRQQSDALETFTQGRTDPLTGVGNGRALEQQLHVLLTGAARGNLGFAVALVSLDRDTSTPEGRSLTSVLPLLPKLAGVIRTCMRDTDFVARYGDDEFVVIMPQTTLVGASIFGDRVRKRVVDELQATVCGGLAEALPTDEGRTLLARADSALYSAKAAGPNRIFVHSGSFIREHQSGPISPESAGGVSRQNTTRAQSAGRDLLAAAPVESLVKADGFVAQAVD